MSKVDYIWRKSPVSKTHKYLDNFPVIKKLLNIRQDSFISTLKEQLSKIDDRDHVLVDVSPLCTQYIDKTSNLDKALADYFTAKKNSKLRPRIHLALLMVCPISNGVTRIWRS